MPIRLISVICGQEEKVRGRPIQHTRSRPAGEKSLKFIQIKQINKRYLFDLKRFVGFLVRQHD